MKQTQCLFVVQKADFIGRRTPTNLDPNGEPYPEGDVYNVEATPYVSSDPNDPNHRFFEATPAGQIQLFNVMNFRPKVGSILEVLITFDEAEDPASTGPATGG